MLSRETNKYRYFIEFAYNGKSYHGWQIQPNALTVQEVLNNTFSTLLGEQVNLVGAGRTDTGVHAAHFVAHVDLKLPILNPEEMVYKANRFIQGGIRIDAIREVSSDLHARFSALSRTYHYVVSRKKSVFLGDFAWHISRDLDFDLLCEAAKSLTGYTDFTSFARLHADNKTNDCKVVLANWKKYGDYWVFQIKADRFLRNMVRAIVGTLLEVGRNKITLDEFREIILAKDRSLAGQSAPAHGLFLSHVEYPQEGFQTSPRSPFFELF